MDTAAVEGRVGEADEEPRTITWRFVDLSAERRFDGGATRCQLLIWRKVQEARLTLAGDGDSLALQINVVPFDA